MFACRLIVDPPQPGAWNMAADEALLIDAAEKGTATLRFYQWVEPTLSLGYFQRYDDRHEHAASRNCAVVRRQSGGGAILHDRELTYSLALPAEHSFAGHTSQLYLDVHRAFIDALTRIVPGGSQRWKLRCCEGPGTLPPDRQPFMCFQRRSPGDVLLAPDGDARRNEVSLDRATKIAAETKILGSAQRRYRGAILQHGSVLLQRSEAAPELIGLSDLTGARVDIPEVVALVTSQLERILQLQLSCTSFPPELESKAAALANNKYGSQAWTKRR